MKLFVIVCCVIVFITIFQIVYFMYRPTKASDFKISKNNGPAKKSKNNLTEPDKEKTKQKCGNNQQVEEKHPTLTSTSKRVRNAPNGESSNKAQKSSSTVKSQDVQERNTIGTPPESPNKAQKSSSTVKSQDVQERNTIGTPPESPNKAQKSSSTVKSQDVQERNTIWTTPEKERISESSQPASNNIIKTETKNKNAQASKEIEKTSNQLKNKEFLLRPPEGKTFKKVCIPEDVVKSFLNATQDHSDKGVEVMGYLLGIYEHDYVRITHIFIPKQIPTPNSCEDASGDQEMSVRAQYELARIGVIHTHPSHRLDYSSADLHGHFQFQKLYADFHPYIGIVTSSRGYHKIYRITEFGMEMLEKCDQNPFDNHVHEEPRKFYEKQSCSFTFRPVIIIDGRKWEVDTEPKIQSK